MNELRHEPRAQFAAQVEAELPLTELVRLPTGATFRETGRAHFTLATTTSVLPSWNALLLSKDGFDGNQSRGYPRSNFVYLLSADFAPAFLRNAKIAPPATKPPNKATITIGLINTSKHSFLEYECSCYPAKVLELPAKMPLHDDSTANLRPNHCAICISYLALKLVTS